MKRFICMLVAVGLFLSLCACSSYQTFEDAEWDLKVDFPEDMHVFVVSQVQENDPALSEYNVNYSKLKEFGDETSGGKFYGKSADGKREYSVSVLGSQNTIDIWEFSQDDRELVKQIVDSAAESLNVDGYTVVSEKEYPQDGICFIEFELRDNGASGSNAMMLYTIKNGLQYTGLYRCDALNDDNRKEAEDLFYNFFITKNIPKNGTEKDNRFVIIFIIAIIILFVAVVVFILYRLFKSKESEKDSQQYKKQFDFDGDENKPDKNKRNKR